MTEAANTTEDDLRAHVNYIGQSWPIAPGHCSRCNNWFFWIDWPGYEPKFCAYCGAECGVWETPRTSMEIPVP